jgi:hypothetical protein
VRKKKKEESKKKKVKDFPGGAKGSSLPAN